MAEPIFSREFIARQAEAAAQEGARTGSRPPNPHPFGSDAAAAWEVSFERYMHAAVSPDVEASA